MDDFCRKFTIMVRDCSHDVSQVEISVRFKVSEKNSVLPIRETVWPDNLTVYPSENIM